MGDSGTGGRERLLAFARQLYEDHKDRHERSQHVALGLVAFNGVLLALIGSALWEARGSQSCSLPLLCLCLLAGAMVLLVGAAVVLMIVVTRVQVSWPDLPKLHAAFEAQPRVADPDFLSGIYAEAVDDNEAKVGLKFQLIAVANYLTMIALVSIGVGVLGAVISATQGQGPMKGG